MKKELSHVWQLFWGTLFGGSLFCQRREKDGTNRNVILLSVSFQNADFLVVFFRADVEGEVGDVFHGIGGL